MCMGLLRRKRDPVLETLPWPLDLVLQRLSKHKGDTLSIRDFLEGFLVTGSLGSGKTSGSIRNLTRGMLAEGFGGLCIGASPEARQDMIDDCEMTGRSKDLMIFGIDQPYRYNMLGGELARQGQVENVVELLCTIAEATDGYQKSGGDQSFWMTSMREMVGFIATALNLSVRDLNLVDIKRMCSSLPTTPALANDRNWQKNSFAWMHLVNAAAQELSASELLDLEFASEYLLGQISNMGSDTRGSIVLTFSAMVSSLLAGSLRELFTLPTNEDALQIDPVAFTEAGGVLFVDLPVEKYNQVGKYASVIIKTVWQRGMMARGFIPGETRPNFLICDEFQHVLTSYDMPFLQSSRRHGICSLYATQNLNNLLAGLGGPESRATVDAVCSLLGTKIFHAQSDVLTNQWASQCIGSDEFIQPTYSVSLGNGYESSGQGGNAGGNTSERAVVRPIEFTTLRKGGPPHMETDSFLFQVGRKFKKTGRNFVPVTWPQIFKQAVKE